jgi:hypothetical protein
MLQAGFSKASQLEYNGQKVIINDSALQSMDIGTTHNTHILSVNFSAIG